MATWTTPRTWVVGEVATAAELNEQLRDNTTFLHAAHGCEVYKTTDQTITTSVRSALAWDAEYYDTDGFHDPATNNSQIKAPAGFAGYYRFMPQILWASSATNIRNLALRINGDNTAAGVQWVVKVNPPTGQFSQQLVADLYLNAGDYVEAMVYQTSGGDLSIFAQSQWDGTNSVSASLMAVQFLGV